MLKTKNGTLRVYHIQNGNMAHQLEVETPMQAIAHIELWADEDLKNPNIEFNAFGLEVFNEEDLDNGNAGWSEWYNSDGEDIQEIMDEIEDMLR